MPFIKKNNEDFYIENNQIKLSKDYFEKNKLKFKKITGSRFSSVIGLNEYTSPFKTWCIMTGLYTEPMDEMISKAGCVIEPKIKDLVSKKLNVNYIQYDPFKISFDLFKENKIFGGIPDGEPVVNNIVNYDNSKRMLEIKTTSIDAFSYKKVNNLFILQKDENNYPIIKSKGTKKMKWFDNEGNVIVPVEYECQLSLYCYLRGISKGIFAICFLETEDYVNPENCDVNNRDVQLVNLDIDLNKFELLVNQATDWYNNFIETGVSPVMNNEDIEFIKSELKL